MKRIVIKVGTAILSRPEGGLNLPRIKDLARELSSLAEKGYAPILVTSGAIGAGMDASGGKYAPPF
jgi:glutamate 5-kinase